VQDRRVRQRNSSFSHHLDQVPRTQFVSEIPAHAKHNDFPIEMTSLEQIQRSHPGPLSRPIPSVSSLHQNQIATELDARINTYSIVLSLSKKYELKQSRQFMMPLSQFKDVPRATSLGIVELDLPRRLVFDLMD
jgi:hypothetical protein